MSLMRKPFAISLVSCWSVTLAIFLFVAPDARAATAVLMFMLAVPVSALSALPFAIQGNTRDEAVPVQTIVPSWRLIPVAQRERSLPDRRTVSC